ncbi:hypothetical protein IKE71_00930 [Candidatus Saccharibacteria bacterium]|nr:hypothetical protein [Candidatus Saccharibacteria bacterium]
MATRKTSSKKSTKTPAKKTPAKKTAAKSVAKTVAKPAPAKKTVHSVEPYHPAFGIIILVVCAILLALLLPFTIKKIIDYTATDAMRFSDEYSTVEVDNVFEYKTGEEISNILEHGTGVVFLGFPSCPWCQAYAKMLNDLAKEKGIEKIYYYNVHDDREKNTDFYKKLVGILGDYLQYNNTGEKRIYVPNATFVIDGEIVGNDWETSKDTLGLEKPEEYWTEERVAAWKEKVGAMMEKLVEKTGCKTTCNE